MTEKVVRSDREWRERLTKAQYRVTRLKGTEAPFSGEYHDSQKPGVYHCVGCGNPLFSSAAKYDSGSGWPSFSMPLADQRVLEVEDPSLGTHRTEVLCRRCDGHLGHVFEDGPAPTGLRYCINSVALRFHARPDPPGAAADSARATPEGARAAPEATGSTARDCSPPES